MGSLLPLLAPLGIVAAALLSHLLLVRAADQPWVAAAFIAPLLLGGAVSAWRARRQPGVALAVAGAVGVAAIAIAIGRHSGGLAWIYLAQHAGVHLVLGIVFGGSLRGERSMIGRVAERVHALTPAMVRYTHQLTRLWTAYFLGMAALSVIMFRTASWASWSLLANVATPVLIASLLVGEHALRYRLHPDFERVSLRASIGAWRARPAPARRPSPEQPR